MSWFSTKKYNLVLLILLSIFFVPGCGFTPIYKNSTGDPLQKQFDFVTIDPISSIPGLHLRNQLINKIHPRGTAKPPLYKLSVQLSSRTEPLLIQLDNTATRNNIKMDAKFVLTDISKNIALFAGSVSSVGSFNVVESDFATISAEKNTMRRVSEEIANKIFESLIVYFVAKS